MRLGLSRWRAERWIRAARGATGLLRLDCCQVRPTLQCGHFASSTRVAHHRPQRDGGETRHGQFFFLLLLKVFTPLPVKNRKGCRRQAHAVSDNPPSTAGTHRHYPTKIIQRKHNLSGLFPLFPPCISLFKDWVFPILHHFGSQCFTPLLFSCDFFPLKSFYSSFIPSTPQMLWQQSS